MFAYDEPKKKAASQSSQWSCESNRKRKTQGSFLDTEFSSSASYNVYEVLQRQTTPTAPNASTSTGGSALPSDIRERFEKRSGYSLADVLVHYNSEEPAKLGAYAYARGNTVHIGPGQEQHLPHEIGHVVQQKAGLVRPTGTINGVNVNTDETLEKKADGCNGDVRQDISSINSENSIRTCSDVAQLIDWKVVVGDLNDYYLEPVDGWDSVPVATEQPFSLMDPGIKQRMLSGCFQRNEVFDDGFDGETQLRRGRWTARPVAAPAVPQQGAAAATAPAAVAASATTGTPGAERSADEPRPKKKDLVTHDVQTRLNMKRAACEAKKGTSGPETPGAAAALNSESQLRKAQEAKDVVKRHHDENAAKSASKTQDNPNRTHINRGHSSQAAAAVPRDLITEDAFKPHRVMRDGVHYFVPSANVFPHIHICPGKIKKILYTHLNDADHTPLVNDNGQILSDNISRVLDFYVVPNIKLPEEEQITRLYELQRQIAQIDIQIQQIQQINGTLENQIAALRQLTQQPQQRLQQQLSEQTYVETLKRIQSLPSNLSQEAKERQDARTEIHLITSELIDRLRAAQNRLLDQEKQIPQKPYLTGKDVDKYQKIMGWLYCWIRSGYTKMGI
ncbi:MAG: DUF4157 domain-containing protein [Candidatus Bathyarchaeota archaeon]|nr:DUF4157 domain-containing protein [Candidatus Termiticorpusculum sp.]